MKNETGTQEHGHFNGLSPAEDEALALIAEECAEVIQAVTKIQRHGLHSHHPDSPHISNRTTLQKEIGDLQAALHVGDMQVLVDVGAVGYMCERKLENLPKYLHHAKVTRGLPSGFVLSYRESVRVQQFPEALEALADWYDYDAAGAEAVGALECVAHDEKRAAELRVEAARLRKEQEA